MEKREELIDKLEEARLVLDQAVSKLPGNKEVFPGWKKRELLAHIAGWDELVEACLEAHAVGKPPVVTTPDIDIYNEISLEKRKDAELKDIEEEYYQRRKVVLDLIRSLPEDKLSQRFMLPWQQEGCVEDIAEIFSEHELYHARKLAR